jgi:hypothetical protein
MGFTKDSAVDKARSDLAERLGIAESEIKLNSLSDKEFPDMSLGSPEKGEMSAQMISSGWEIKLGAGGKTYDYRADKYQLRLHNFRGTNHIIKG